MDEPLWRQRPRRRKNLPLPSVSCVALILLGLVVLPVRTQCPWSKSLTDLHSSCSCSFVQSKLNVQCNAVNVTRLLEALRGDKVVIDGDNANETAEVQPAAVTPIESLMVTNSSLPILADNAFFNLRVANIHLAGCGLRNISAHALRTSNLEEGLFSLGLPDNELTDRALASLRKLRSLSSLDLSRNRIARLSDDAFEGLSSLDTLNLMENNLTSIEPHAFRGMETSLKNLNLKATGQRELPQALRNMRALAFLDLAQNSIDSIETGQSFFQSMDSLTALSLERNRLGHLEAEAFAGLEDTMTSLSLLNNEFKEMPKLANLKELRVLDLGFNRIYEIADDAFKNLTSLTLLALDGNPLETLPFAALKHLHSTLRGLSIGGKSLVCDCHVRWIAEWVREFDLQVTSRERNPQFCGHPQAQQNKNLYLLRPAQLVCSETTTTTTSTEPIKTTGTTRSAASTSTEMTPPTNLTTTPSSTTSSTTTIEPKVTSTMTPRSKSLEIVNVTTITRNPLGDPSSIVRTNNNQRSARKENTAQDIKIGEAFREDTNVVLTWELRAANAVPGFRVIYRTFGDERYKEGAVLPLRVRKFRMTNVPMSECCLIVCVISLGEPSSNLTLDNVPASQCRELKWGNGGSSSDEGLMAAGQSNVEMLVIILIMAVACTVIVAVLIVCVCCCRQRQRRRREKDLPAPPPPIVDLPPLDVPSSSLKPEWDQTSAYSSRSIPRARMYHMGRTGGTVNSAYLQDDMRSHLSHMSLGKHHGGAVDERATHSMIDGQYGVSSYADSQYPMGRQELNRSSKSLAMSMPVYHVHNHQQQQQQLHNNNNQNRKKNKSQHQRNNGHANGYGERSDNGYYNPNPWSSPADVDHYNPNGSHVSQPFNKRDFT